MLKHDTLGVVELLSCEHGQWVRRVASGRRWRGVRLIALWLLARERRALLALAGLRGVPILLDDGRRGRDAVLQRTWLPGEPLWRCTALPADFFELLAELVAALHARGVCHNDLHKENNIIVGPDGWPGLIDFQVASVHPRGGALFTARCREDLRFVMKHRVRYERQGRLGPADLPRRSTLATLWRRLYKPLRRMLRRRLLRCNSGEPRRPRGGPWPRWTSPVGPLGWIRG